MVGVRSQPAVQGAAGRLRARADYAGRVSGPQPSSLGSKTKLYSSKTAPGAKIMN